MYKPNFRTAQKGSLTLEATISMSIFILAVLSIAFIMRIVFLHSMLQHAICDTTNRIAAMSYMYYKSGIMDSMTATADKSHAAGIVNQVVESYDSLNNIAADTSQESLETNLDKMLSNLGTSDSALITTLKNDPKLGAICFLLISSKGITQNIKSDVFKYLVKGTIEKNGKDANVRLRGLGVVGGFDSLDFSASKYLEDEKTFDIVVGYKVKMLLLPELGFVQRASARAWLGGEYMSSSKTDEGMGDKKSIWDLNPLTRGILFQEKLKLNNLPHNFPVLTFFDFKEGKAISVHSKDIRASTYVKGNMFEKEVKQHIDTLYAFKGASSSGVTISDSTIKSKILMIVIPKVDGLPENINKAQALCAEYAQTKGIKIEFIADDGSMHQLSEGEF